jgi:DNA-3-methyladenine glycosylase I
MNYAAFDGFDMRRRGMKFVGATTVYAFLQAAGYIDAHGPECDLGNRRIF